MLRTLIVLLIVANMGYFAFTQSWLAPLGLVPASPSETHRMGQQIQPDAIRLLSPAQASKLDQQANSKAAECWVTPLLSVAQVGSARVALETWPVGTWQLTDRQQPARWIIYMGKYADTEALQRKKSELRKLGLTYESLRKSMLEPGLSLGHYPSKDEAERTLQALSQKGVRTARVLEEMPAQTGQQLRLLVVDEDLRSGLDTVRMALGGDAQLARCAG